MEQRSGTAGSAATEGRRLLYKHLKYKDAYIPNDFYWGLGLEHETYIETSARKTMSLLDVLKNTNRERYSVSYFKNYKNEFYERAMLSTYNNSALFHIPVLWNSHHFTHCDSNGNHKTLYKKDSPPNPDFSGTTLWDDLLKSSPWLKEHYEKEFVFDGDTIEFTTMQFYKASVQSVLKEYNSIRTNWINELQRRVPQPFVKPLRISSINHPFATYSTNLSNIAMFNNGTFHINITLPTRLDSQGQIKDMVEFTNNHRTFARAIQWMEPLWVAMYGAPDPLSAGSGDLSSKFSKASQRVAVSRYISIGTFDTDKMERGKILQIEGSSEKYSWIPSQNPETAYTFQEKIGLDLNFNKHFQHGLELRWFDQISLAGLKEILRTLVALADTSLVVGKEGLPNPVKSAEWRTVAKLCLMNGALTEIPEVCVAEYEQIFRVGLSKTSMKACDLYMRIANALCSRTKGLTCSKLFYPEETVVDSIDTGKMNLNWYCCC